MFSAKNLFFGKRTGGYQISRSLRFRSSATAYLSRTPGSAGNRKTWTFSAWVKRAKLGSEQGLFYRVSPTGTDTDSFAVTLVAGDTISLSGYATNWRITTQVFRDVSAWYHIVVAVDTTQATANNRVRLYVNGSEVTAFSTTNNPALNADTGVNSTAQHSIGSEQTYTSGREFDGYLAEVNFIDGQALTPSSFGENDATTGVWKPKAYTGTYGTNGFYLKFTDIGSTTAGGANTGYGKDFAGTNNWTTNNLNSTSTSTSYDSMIDTPTPYDDGGNGVGNYCVLNAVETNYGTLSNANLSASLAVTGTTGKQARGTFRFPSSGKYYFEVNPSSLGAAAIIGVAKFSAATNGGGGISPAFSAGDIYCYISVNGQKTDGVTSAAYGASYTTANTIGVAADVDNGTLTFYKDNVSQGTAYSSLTLSNYYPVIHAAGASGTCACDINFGQRPFTYTPPSGFKALNTQNLPTPTIAAGGNYMAAVLYNGTSASNTVTATASNSGNNPLALTFQPDLVWIKSRSAATNHKLTDAVRGVTKALISNTTGAETTDTNGLTAFTSSGFTVGSDSVYNNGTGPATYVAWEWIGGGAPTTDNVAGAGNVPTAGSVKINGSNSTSALSGSIAATRLSANTTAGFSVVTWSGNTTANSTVGHGLGAPVDFAIIKNRNTAGNDWVVWHRSVTSGNGKYLYLDLTNAIGGPAGTPVWDSSNTSTQSSSSTFTIGANSIVNSGNMLMYCFAAVSGYSAFGSYTGNGSADGPFVFTGFRPRYVLLKRTDTAEDWVTYDTARELYNVEGQYLIPNSSAAEPGGTTARIDILSNGFKLRNSGQSNTSGGTYIYAAFCENPFKYSLAR